MLYMYESLGMGMTLTFTFEIHSRTGKGAYWPPLNFGYWRILLLCLTVDEKVESKSTDLYLENLCPETFFCKNSFFEEIFFDNFEIRLFIRKGPSKLI